MSDETEQEDPREHIDDIEWLWQHGYLDGTLYDFSRRLHDLFHQIWDVAQDTVRPLVLWLARRLGR